MKSYKSYSEGTYLKQSDVTIPVVWTITDVQERLIAVPGKKPKPKLVLFFDGNSKGLVLNMSNGNTLFDMTGQEDPEEWLGTQVELYVDDSVNYAGKRVGGVRLRKPPAKEPVQLPTRIKNNVLDTQQTGPDPY
jgi:hypothetical protein